MAFRGIAGYLPGTRQGGLDRSDQALIVERLLDEIDGARLHCPHCGLHIAVPGHDDYRRTKAKTIESSLKLESIHFRHPDIEQYAPGG
jgi:hypothetical protein